MKCLTQHFVSLNRTSLINGILMHSQEATNIIMAHIQCIPLIGPFWNLGILAHKANRRTSG